MKRLSLLFPAMLLAGCTVGPDYERPAVAGAAPGSGWVEPAETGAVEADWWRQFGDDRLTALIERALADSPDMTEARARLAEARATRDSARGGALPTVSATGSATENRLSENGQFPINNIPGFARDFGLFDLGFDASWEIDLWGRDRRQIEAAGARVDAAEAGRREAMVMLAAEIARNYLDLRAAQAETNALEAIAAADGELARLTALRYAAGEASLIDRDSAEATARSSQAALADPRTRASAAAYRIAVLAGSPPEAIVPELREPAAIPVAPDSILVGIRSDLLERRPDVRRAERTLAAATAEIGVATADLFPRFTLFGGIGRQARDIGNLDEGGSTRFQIGPSFSWPIFNGGTVRARIRAADARADVAAAQYEKAVLGALSDSEAAINRFLNARGALTEAEAALSAQQRAFALAGQRTRSGEDDSLALMRADKALRSAERGAIAARQAKGAAAVALFKALGGGWREESGALVEGTAPAALARDGTAR